MAEEQMTENWPTLADLAHLRSLFAMKAKSADPRTEMSDAAVTLQLIDALAEQTKEVERLTQENMALGTENRMLLNATPTVREDAGDGIDDAVATLRRAWAAGVSATITAPSFGVLPLVQIPVAVAGRLLAALVGRALPETGGRNG